MDHFIEGIIELFMELLADSYFAMYKKLLSLIFPKQKGRKWIGIAGVTLGWAVILLTFGLLIWGAYGVSEHQPYGLPICALAVSSFVVQVVIRSQLEKI